MPQIPEFQLTQDLPSTGGMGRVAQQVPVVPQRGVPLGMAGALSGAVQQVGAQAQQVGDLLERQRQAQDVLDATQTAQEYQIRAQERFAEMAENGDFRTLPEDMEREGRVLMADLGQGLSPRAQQRFQIQATGFLANLHAKALGVQSARRDEQKRFVFQQALTEHTRGIVEAENPADAAYHQAALTQTFRDAVEVGLINGQEAAKAVQGATDQAELQKVRTAARLRPTAVLTKLQEQANAGKDLIAGVPIADVIDEVRQQVRADAVEVERQERHAARKVVQDQEDAAVLIRSELYDPALTLETVRTLRTKINTLGQQRRLSETDHAALVQDAATFEKALVRGPVVTDPTVERRALILLHGELSGNNLDLFKDQVVQWLDDGRVGMEQAQKWFTAIDQQRQANHYSNMPAYKEARDFLRTTVNFLSNMSLMPGANEKTAEQLQSRMAYALQTYSETMQLLWQQEGPRAVEQRAFEEARRIQALFNVTPPEVLESFPIPPALQGVQGATVDERYQHAYSRLQAMDLSDAERAEQFRLLQQRQVIERQIELGAANKAQSGVSTRPTRGGQRAPTTP